MTDFDHDEKLLNRESDSSNSVSVKNDDITVPAVGEILQKEFMKPMGISASELAKIIRMPESEIQDLLQGRRKITEDISLRLAEVFGVSDDYFLDMQNDTDRRNQKAELYGQIADGIDDIKKGYTRPFKEAMADIYEERKR